MLISQFVPVDPRGLALGCFTGREEIRRLGYALAALIAIASGSYAGDVAAGSELVQVTPITDRIMALHFDDGRVIRHAAGESIVNDEVRAYPLAVAALQPSVFTIVAPLGGDSAYDTARPPAAVNRKSKGTEYANRGEQNPGMTYDFSYGWRSQFPYWASEHWIYITLPEPLQSGVTYTITWNASTLNTRSGAVTFTFDENTLRSEAVHVNSLGYVPSARMKYGYIHHWAGDRGGVDFSAYAGRPFRLIRTDIGASVFTGTVAFRLAANGAETARTGEIRDGNFLGTAVWECNFSAFTGTPGYAGQYRLVVPGLGASFPFRIAPDIYHEPFRAVMKGVYQNRSGIALELPYADEPRPAPHNPRLTPGFANRLFYTPYRYCDMLANESGNATDKAEIERLRKGNLQDTWGWYQDAGDWDGYETHQSIPLSLLTYYILAPQKFSDGQLSLPERANGIPDIVDEGAWLLRYQHRLRHELMRRQTAGVSWGTGGVSARVFGDQWGDDRPGGIGSASWQDTRRDWYVLGEDPFNTYRYAASAALMAEILRSLGKSDPEGVNWHAEAVEAYAWAQANTRAGDETGTRRGGPLSHPRAVAALALYRLTGENAYHQRFLADTGWMTGSTSPIDEPLLQALALYGDLPAGRSPDPVRGPVLKTAFNNYASFMTLYAYNSRASRWGGNYWQPMNVGASTTPLVTPAVLAVPSLLRSANTSTRDNGANINAVVSTTADYFLGGNALNMTWISGVGPRHPTGLFHLDDWYAGPTRRTGLIPYGPWVYGDSWIKFSWGQVARNPVGLTWAWDTTYPAIDSDPATAWADTPGTWPAHESWFEQAISPQATEFTVWQTNLPAAMTYGSLMPDLAPTPWQSWQRANYTYAEIAAGLGSPLAEPAGGGMTNLMLYALGVADLRGGQAPTAIAAASPTVSLAANGRLTLTFTRARSDVRYEVLASTDLSAWTVIATDPGTFGTSVTVTDTAPPGPRRFLRLRTTIR